MGATQPGRGVVVAGAGQAGVETAAALRDYGYEEPITLLGEEPGAPYQRPPLSKDFLSGRVDADGLALRSADFYADRGIELATGRRVEAILPAQHRVLLDGGGALGYRHLVLATGARSRPLTVPGADLDGVCYLRTLAEAAALRERLARPCALVVVGGGFIGLELAAVAAAGHRVTVVESAPRCMARVVTPAVSAHAEAVHRRCGAAGSAGATPRCRGWRWTGMPTALPATPMRRSANSQQQGPQRLAVRRRCTSIESVPHPVALARRSTLARTTSVARTESSR
jgi:3-phenylpropionate/trans-cinnamate dioxygenase ferredoxin reductase component